MRTITVQERYNAVNESRFSKTEFLNQMRKEFPSLVNQFNGYEDAVQILKNRGLLTEYVVKEEVSLEDRFSLDAIDLGISYELANLGYHETSTPSKEDYVKAKERTLNNLNKDVTYYIQKKVGKDKSLVFSKKQEPSPKSSVIDKENGMQKVKPKSTGKTTGKVVKYIKPKEKLTIKESRVRGLIDNLHAYGKPEQVKQYLEALNKDINENGDQEYRGWKPENYIDDFQTYISNAPVVTEKSNTPVDSSPYITHYNGKFYHDKTSTDTGIPFEPGASVSFNYKGTQYTGSITHREQGDNYEIDLTPENNEPINETKVKNAMKSLISQILKEEKRQVNEAAASNLEKYVNYENDRNEDLARRIRKAANDLAEHIYKLEKAFTDARENIEDIYKSVGPYMSPALSVAFIKDIKPVLDKYTSIALPKRNELTPEELERINSNPGKVPGTNFSLNEKHNIPKRPLK